MERWNPEHCGEMDLVIKADGSWWHEGSMITRAPLVRLFSRILRKDPEGYVLVTPAEKVTIKVEDVPFLAVDYDRTDRGYEVRTNVGDRVLIDADHPITLRHSEALGQRAPYILIRGGLEARLDRAPYYRLVEELPVEDGALVLRSGGATFRLPIEADA
ncbi:hypothetical protein GCM10007148_08510 [Parvularcula lutaonensis]|nr:hypothetical protein GCM10007148_08510 [Parvularcula lutaonensis]